MAGGYSPVDRSLTTLFAVDTWRALRRGDAAGSSASDRGQTGDVQLGKLIDEGPEDYDPWG